MSQYRKLRPCPYCGGHCHVERVISDMGTEYDVQCARCHMRAYLGYRAHARKARKYWLPLKECIIAWNRGWDAQPERMHTRVRGWRSGTRRCNDSLSRMLLLGRER